jgi:hypothetical protein
MDEDPCLSAQIRVQNTFLCVFEDRCVETPAPATSFGCKIQCVIDHCHKLGIRVIANNTPGLPNDTVEGIQGPREINSRFGALWIMALMAIATCAQATAAPASKEKKPVYVTASFLDRNDLFIEDLQMSEVEILEDNQPRKIEFMAREELPTVYGMVFDGSLLAGTPDRYQTSGQAVSNSVAARDIACQLIDKQLGRQMVWIGAYDQELQIALDALSDGFRAKQAIHQLYGTRSRENSSLFSPLFTAVDKMEQRHEKRRVLILFLETLDPETASRIKPLKNLLASSNVEIFALCFANRLARAGSMPSAMTTSPLMELTQATSGYAFFSMDYRDHFEDIVRRLLNHLRTLYTFGFTSESVRKGQGKLVIKCSRPNSRVRCHPEVPVYE